jgi:alkylation response protein AidB-like acyl-CoA dehydrogenase
MNFALSEPQRALQQKVRDYAASTIDPVVAELDKKGSCPLNIISGLADLGLLGAERDFVAYVAALEEISKSWASLGAIVAVHNSLVCYPILRFGDDAQKKKFLPLLTEERHLGCYAFAEPSAGSDAGAIQTTATPDGDGFVINGHKLFVTNGRHARLAIVYASTDRSLGRDGLSAFIVERDTPGFSVGDVQEKLGLRAAETVEIFLRDCRVPKANLLGGLNRGFAIARAIVEGARIDIAAQAVGIAQACLDRSVAHAKERRQFGRPIAEFEAIQWMVADMATEIEAARLMMYRAASLRARIANEAATSDGPAPSELREPTGALTIQASMAKLFASEAANKAAYTAVQIFGGHGYLTDFPVERYFRDARAMTLFEETSEIDRLVIERELAR